jgi:hypothetical protein
MTKYKVLVTKFGLNLNYEDIGQGVLDTFETAFPAGTLSNFGHRLDKDDYVPKVGVVQSTSVDGNYAYAVIDYNDEISNELDSGREFNVSIYSRCKSHYCDNGIRYIDELIYDKTNSIDIVKFGAVPEAKIEEKVENNLNTSEWISCSAKAKFEKVDEITNQKKNIKRERKISMTEDEIKALSDSIVNSVSALLKSEKAEAEEKETQNEKTEADEAQKAKQADEAVANAFRVAGGAGLPDELVDEVANSLTVDSDIEKIIADKKALVESIANSLKKETENDEISNNFRVLDGTGNDPYSGMDSIMRQVVGKKGNK